MHPNAPFPCNPSSKPTTRPKPTTKSRSFTQRIGHTPLFYPSHKQYLVVYTEELRHLRRSPPRPSIARRTARLLDARSNVVSIFTEARCDTGSATLDLPLARVGVALVAPKEAHRVFILDILGTIYDVDHLALSTNSVTGTNVLDNLLKLVRHRVPITPDFNSNLVVRHRTSSRLWPDPQCPQLLAVRSIRCAALFALKEACALILSDVWTTDSDPVETFCPRSPQVGYSAQKRRAGSGIL